MSNTNYDSDSIQVLEGLEAVRKRPGMYIGNVDKKGLHHLVWEIVDNSIDEHLAGHANKINVTILKDGSISISDNGRGIPVAIHAKTGISALETVLTVLHAGGKFGGDNSGYKVSGGLHGVGASVVNALSVSLEAIVKRDGKKFSLKYKEGGELENPLKEEGTTLETGTQIVFYPDFALFNDGVNSFDSSIITERLQQSAYLNKGLEISFIDYRDDTNVVYKYEKGLVDFVNHLNKDKEPIFKEVIHNEGVKEGIAVDVAFQYTRSYQPVIYSYVNNIFTGEGGTHLQGFQDALLRIINKYVEEYIPQKERETFKRDDIKEGLTAVISVKHPSPMFEGQTKNKLANIEVRKIVNNIISDRFEEFLLENPMLSNLIIAKLKQASRSRIAAQKAREAVRKESSNEFSTLPGKLSDCSSKDSSITELFIVEGDSAGGSAKMGRDREIQAILPLKGKIINAQKARIDKLFQNDEITALITAIGAGFGEDFDLEKLRYGKVIIMTDADVDGSHIRTLILTFFYRYMRTLIESGNIYIAQPPLYKITRGKTSFYVYTEDEKKQIIDQFEDNVKFGIQRYKGLGEMNDDQLWETTMDPENRKMLRVQISDAAESEKVFEELMGDAVEPRKEFIVKNAKLANLDI